MEHGTYICSGSEAVSYLRLIDFVYHPTLGLRVMKKKKNLVGGAGAVLREEGHVAPVRLQRLRRGRFQLA